jgi:glycosyltransferase involved in cell wall biosynthesis
MKKKLIRTATIPASLSGLLFGQLKFMSEYYEVIGVSSNNPDQLEKLSNQENIKTFPVNMYRQIAPLKDLKSLWQLYVLLKKEKPFIVHSITPKAGLLTMIAAKLAGVPHRLHTFTGLIFPTKSGWIQKLLIFTDKLLCYCATNIYPEGEGVKKDLLTYKITSKPLKILGNGNVNGIDINYFSPQLFDENSKSDLKEKLKIKKEDFVFVFVGRLVRDKGINELVNVFNKLSNKIEQIKLLLIGDYEETLDPLEAETLDLIKKNQHIITTGWTDDVRPYFAISDVLTFPSYREGFPNVVMQAGSMGLPSIVSNISGCNEIIIEGENGTIISPKNTEQLYDKMLSIYQKKLQFDSLKCRELIVSRYEQKRLWQAVLKEYQDLE